jgi:lantibiotic modifying enzyme
MREEIMRAALQDAEMLKATFRSVRSEVDAIGGPFSDRHNGGRTVRRVALSSGITLAYKPRSLAMEQCFDQLLSWLAERYDGPMPTALNVLDRNTHGWMPWIEHAECETNTDVERFYEREGFLMCLVYLLNGNDMTSENIIASSDQLVAIDLETLFQPERPMQRYVAIDAFEKAMSMNILQTGFLPSGITERDGCLYDPSAMTSTPAVGNSVLSVPLLNGTPQLAYAFADNVIHGFCTAYNLIMTNKRALLASSGPIAAFAEISSRYVVRATRVYGVILQALTRRNTLAWRHPQQVLALLSRKPVREGRLEAERNIVAAEADALLAGDVPYFAIRADSRMMYVPNGPSFPDYVPRSGMDVVVERLSSISASNRDRQIRHIKSSLRATVHRAPEYQARGSGGPVFRETSDRFMMAANQVRGRLMALRETYAGQSAWFGIHPVSDHGDFRYGACGMDLYSGHAGVAVFMARYAHVVQTQAAINEAARVAEPLLELTSDHDKLMHFANAFGGGIQGLAGIGWALHDIGISLECEAFRSAAACVFKFMSIDNVSLDVVSGLSGTALCVLPAALFGNATASKVQEELRARLASSLNEDQLLLFSDDMAHGWLGMKVAARAYGVEVLFEPGHPKSSVGWCRGWAGQVIALTMLGSMSDQSAANWVSATTRDQLKQLALDDSLCCGNAAAAEALMRADRAWPGSGFMRFAIESASSLEHRFLRNHLRFPSFGKDAPGLYTGLAGVGSVLLNAARPHDFRPALV